jgi:hypothetical protein
MTFEFAKKKKFLHNHLRPPQPWNSARDLWEGVRDCEAMSVWMVRLAALQGLLLTGRVRPDRLDRAPLCVAIMDDFPMQNHRLRA